MMRTTLVLSLLMLCAPPLHAQSLDEILRDIGELESVRDPKCYATASRLEDFMYGTPLTDNARYQKNYLQKRLADLVWRTAGKAAVSADTALTPEEIDSAFQQYVEFTTLADGSHQLRFPSGAELEINATDFRQYGSVAYSLRAILGAQQDAMMNAAAEPLPLLAQDAVNSLKDRLDLATLALLKESDAYARAHDEYEVTRENLNRAWLALYESAPQPQEPMQAASTTPVVLERIIAEKIESYGRYNEVSNPLFLRNMQVYFARLSWPSDEQAAAEFRAGFEAALTGYATDLYRGAVDVARANQQPLIREAHVARFVARYTPFEVNEYEDVVYFPNLPEQSVAMEAYDLDAFRDSGLHWLYLGRGLNSGEVENFMDVDPFAAELLAENVAQFGVLMLREAGTEGQRRGVERLSLDLLNAAIGNIQEKVNNTLAGHGKAPAEAPALASAKPPGSVKDQPASTWFSDSTEASGIKHMHRTSDWLNRQLRSYLQKDERTGIITIPPAFGGSGVAVGDINNDGLSDALLLSGLGNRLYENLGDGTFKDITKAAGIEYLRSEDNRPGEPRQPLIADLDNDGWQDLVITYVNDPHRVYRNRGDGTFEDLTEQAGLGGSGLVGGPATVFDFDNDGLLDIYVTYFGNYLRGVLPTLARRNANGLPNVLFRNLGGFRFEAVDAGVADVGWGQAVTHTDFDGDGWQDLISGNDFGVNVYYRNLGNGQFEDVTESLGTGKPSYTMSLSLADLNGDSAPDIYVSNIVVMNKDEKYVLPNEDTQMKFNLEKLANLRVVEANDLFLSMSTDSALPRYQLTRELVGRGYNSTGWSWGASFFDADLDGDDDLYVLNGMNEFNLYSSRNDYAEPGADNDDTLLMPVDTRERNVFFVNSNGKLNNASGPSGLDLLGNSRSAAYFDHDNDGDLDVLINNYHESARLYRNQAEQMNSNWIKLRLRGDPAQGVNLDAIGTRVILSTAEGGRSWREVSGSGGYMTVHERDVHAGLGTANSASALIIWPNGQQSRVTDLAANQIHVISMKTTDSGTSAKNAPP